MADGGRYLDFGCDLLGGPRVVAGIVIIVANAKTIAIIDRQSVKISSAILMLVWQDDQDGLKF